MDIPTKYGDRFTLGDLIEKRPNCYIYKAQDSELADREVVVKVFVDRHNNRADYTERFKAEMSTLADASHPVLVPIIASGIAEGYFYLAMEYIAGQNLKSKIKEKGKLEIGESVDIISKVAEGVREIHNHNGFHGHIDGRAILFKGEEPRLAGYYPGVIGAIQKELTTDGRFIVEPGYVAPEQIGGIGTIDRRVDIYALSVLLYEMITGQRPFSGGSPFQEAALRMTQNPISPAKLNTTVSPLLDAAMLKGLARNPAERFSSVDDFVAALAAARKGGKGPVSSAPLNSAERLGTETIAVSMSTESVRDILEKHDSYNKNKSKETDSAKTVMGVDLRTITGNSSDFTETVMGVSSSSVLPGSLVIVRGNEKGKKFELRNEQAIIGSDQSCDVRLKDKAIQPRYAMVRRKGSGYAIAPLMVSSLTIGGKDNKSSAEVLLNRGDVIEVGSISLRYVAPGEVFTFKDEIADRVIDRPISRTTRVLGVSAVCLVIILGIAVYQYIQVQQQSRLKSKKAQIAQEQEKERLIAQLLKEGDELFKSGALVEPVGQNALERFKQVLSLDSENDYAKRRLVAVNDRLRAHDESLKKRQQMATEINRYLSDGDNYLRAGKIISPPGANARDSYREVLKIDSENDVAKKKLADIDKLIGDMLKKVDDLLLRAEELKRMGQYVEPDGDNALRVLQEVLAMDPKNSKAQNMILDMAAMSIYQGDIAKSALNRSEMQKHYTVAEILGVDPEFLAQRKQGSDLISKSSSTILIVSRGTVSSKKGGDSEAKNFLDMEEIKRRLKTLELRMGAPADKTDKKFITVE